MPHAGARVTAFTNGRIFVEGAFLSGRTVLVEPPSIAAIVGAGDVPDAALRVDLKDRLLLPGFVDLQVNGGGGVLFNARPTVDGVRAIAAAHRRFGTTALLPTLISDDLEVVEQGIAAVREAMRIGVPGIIGIHLEGPFLNPERKGAHDERTLLKLEPRHLDLLTSLDRGHTLVTLAPEMALSGTVKTLAASGVLVSAGHTNATYDVMRQGFDDGVTGVTHLFNAMSPLTARAPGAVGAALDTRHVYCGIIVDGRHVAPATLRIALAAHPRDRFVLVTDAMPSVGAADKSFLLQGKRITVRDGVCVDERGTLSGADLDMASAIRNTVRLIGLPLADAIRMATEYPADMLGRADLGRIAVGARANLVVCNDDLRVEATWIDGRGE